jgi:Cys-tRNA(Pro)/Cys-tRNA(Cys) deacylase
MNAGCRLGQLDPSGSRIIADELPAARPWRAYNAGMESSTPVTRALEALQIPYRLHRHRRPVRSLEQAAAERGLLAEQLVRSLLFRLEDGSYVMVLMPGPAQVSWAKLRHYLGVSRLTTATAEQVVSVTGYPPGAVSPFGLAHPVRLLADRQLFNHPQISLGAGERNAGVTLQVNDLVRALKPEVADLCSR